MWAGAQAQNQAQNQAQPGSSNCQPSSQQANSQEGQTGNLFVLSRYSLHGETGVRKSLRHAQRNATKDCLKNEHFYIKQ